MGSSCVFESAVPGRADFFPLDGRTAGMAEAVGVAGGVGSASAACAGGGVWQRRVWYSVCGGATPNTYIKFSRCLM